MRKKRILAPIILSVSLLSTGPAKAAGSPVEARRCDKAIELARQVGWLKKDLPTLRYIMWRESRCQNGSIGRNYDSITGKVRSRDWGYLQINDASWRTYLISKGIIHKIEDLLNPRINLKAGLELLRYSIRHDLPRWKQWQGTSRNRVTKF